MLLAILPVFRNKWSAVVVHKQKVMCVYSQLIHNFVRRLIP